MAPRTLSAGLIVLCALFHPAAAMAIYEPKLCYILDGFLGLYGLIITGMFIREKFLVPKSKVKSTEESLYTDLRNQDSGGYAPLRRGDPEKGGRNRKMTDDQSDYQPLTRRTDGVYKELPANSANKKDRQRKNEQVYQGLSSATRDTYDSLQMQPLPPR